MKKLEKMTIAIEGNERNRSEIIYNNVLEKLDTKDAKIEYLKERLTVSETENRTKTLMIFTLFLGTMGLGSGFLIALTDLSLLGILLGFASFFLTIYQLYRLALGLLDFYKSDRFSKADNYYKQLNKRLK